MTETARTEKRIVQTPLDFVLDRTLCEVHLLLDFISSCPDRSLPTSIAGDNGGDSNKDWLERVCEIGWPPTPSEAQQHEQATLLTRVKDALNRVAQPASGATIAFTLLVTQEDNADKADHNRVKPNADTDDKHQTLKADVQLRKDLRQAGASAATRTSLARVAYPGLISKGHLFRWANTTIMIVMTAWLIGTCYMSWYVGLGNSYLLQYLDAQKAEAAAIQHVASLESGSPIPATGVVAGGDVGTAGTTVKAGTAKAEPVIPLCLRNRHREEVKLEDASSVWPYATAEELQTCQDRDIATVLLLDAGKRLWAWQHPLPTFFQGLEKLFQEQVSNAPSFSVPSDDTAVAAMTGPQYAAATAWDTLLGTSVLPILYGALGAGASIVRLISSKTRFSQLSPRDLPLALQQLALGAVVGACIGLFVSPQNANAAPGASLLGPVALSSSALSFIAGFGVDGVFRAMEALVGHVFGTGQASPAANAKSQ